MESPPSCPCRLTCSQAVIHPPCLGVAPHLMLRPSSILSYAQWQWVNRRVRGQLEGQEGGQRVGEWACVAAAPARAPRPAWGAALHQRDKLIHYELHAQAGAWRMSVSAIRVQWADIPQPWASAKAMEVRGVWVDKAALQVKVVCWVERQRRLAVTSSSSYSKSSEIKAGNSEVRRVPGNGFSSCAVPTFSRVQGISNGGRNRFPECAGMESVPEQFRV